MLGGHIDPISELRSAIATAKAEAVVDAALIEEAETLFVMQPVRAAIKKGDKAALKTATTALEQEVGVDRARALVPAAATEEVRAAMDGRQLDALKSALAAAEEVEGVEDELVVEAGALVLALVAEEIPVQKAALAALVAAYPALAATAPAAETTAPSNPSYPELNWGRVGVPLADFKGVTLDAEGTVTGLEIHATKIKFDLAAHVAVPLRSTLTALDASGCTQAEGPSLCS